MDGLQCYFWLMSIVSWRSFVLDQSMRCFCYFCGCGFLHTYYDWLLLLSSCTKHSEMDLAMWNRHAPMPKSWIQKRFSFLSLSPPRHWVWQKCWNICVYEGILMTKIQKCSPVYLHRGPDLAASSLSFVVFIVFWNRKFRRDFLDFRCKSHQVSSWSAVVVQKRPSSSKFTVRTESWKREKSFALWNLQKDKSWDFSTLPHMTQNISPKQMT